ncbi:MAG TPA: hypothetical protein H9737_02100 [Candidatus Borkfalkia faecigallinarum]|uniref:Uncharacterized protein n=1 Tax=Candidatus Borkfalkia faecigallinarum TaxID=2838509 RepID=A0A9D2AQR8_9FIRM|nr:hypothetical protein [Candidatus Borkfalkia faecigallinarum]
MNTDELNAAAQKLIEEANTESAAALASYEEDCLRMRFRLLERGTYRSSILSDALHELRADYDAQVLRIQKELDESLEALYAEAQEPEEPGGEEPGGEEPGGEEPGGEEPDAPYEVDESLPMRDRYIAVKNYYLSIPDAAEALELLRDDDVAKEYLGTYYNYLEQLLIMMQ